MKHISGHCILFIDNLLIPEQAGFRPGKSTTSQVFNLTQYIDDGFEEGKVTGVVFVDLSARTIQSTTDVSYRKFWRLPEISV